MKGECSLKMNYIFQLDINMLHFKKTNCYTLNKLEQLNRIVNESYFNSFSMWLADESHWRPLKKKLPAHAASWVDRQCRLSVFKKRSLYLFNYNRIVKIVTKAFTLTGLWINCELILECKLRQNAYNKYFHNPTGFVFKGCNR